MRYPRRNVLAMLPRALLGSPANTTHAGLGQRAFVPRPGRFTAYLDGINLAVHKLILCRSSFNAVGSYVVWISSLVDVSALNDQPPMHRVFTTEDTYSSTWNGTPASTCWAMRSICARCSTTWFLSSRSAQILHPWKTRSICNVQFRRNIGSRACFCLEQRAPKFVECLV